jgi:hypothetical protein
MKTILATYRNAAGETSTVRIEMEREPGSTEDAREACLSRSLYLLEPLGFDFVYVREVEGEEAKGK